MRILIRRPFFLLALIAIFALTYACVAYAAKNAGSYWSAFDSQDGSGSDLASGYVVVDASTARNENMENYGIGPFRANGPSFSDSEVLLEEETTGGEPEKAEESPYWTEITVQTGDTLSVLAEKNGLTIKDLMTANELTNQHRLREGQKLYLPKTPESVQPTLEHLKKQKEEALAKRKEAKPVEITSYIVKNGDTLWSVANTFDLDVNTLFGCNKLSDSSVLKVDATLRVPNQDGIFVTVRANQTLEKLAKEYNIFPEAILAANRMTAADTLVQGKEIFLPDAKVMAFVETGNGKKAVAQNAVAAKRGFGWPVVGKISSPFGWRRDPVRGGRDFHTGLDIRAPRGRPIVAAAAGKVVHSGWMGGYGKTIVLSHPGGMTTLYAHCSSLVVKVGRNVKRGERIALVGSTGRSTGNHLHFEVRKNGTPMNPLKAIR